MFRDLSLSEAIERLSAHPAVMGILLIGSTAGTIKPHSDLDILIIVEDDFPIDVALTYIDNRLTDLVFRPLSMVADCPETVPSGTPQASLIKWFRTGKIEFDREGKLQAFQKRCDTLRIAPNENFKAGAIFGLLYSYHQNLRLWRSDDQLYHEALQLRLLYAVSNLMEAYFYLRDEMWTGEKDAIRYWQAHDAEYYHLLRTTVSTPDLNEKFSLYEQLVDATLQPVDGLVKGDLAIIQPTDWQDSRTGAKALSLLLSELLGEPNHPRNS